MCSTLEHQTKGFSIFDGHTHNPRNNYSSFFRVDFITSSSCTICPKNKTLSWTIITLMGALVGFK
jgi:hypothetical protein